MKKHGIRRGFCALLCAAMLFAAGSQTVTVTADDTAGSTPPIEQVPPDDYVPVEHPGVIPHDLQSYDGTPEGVVAYMQGCLTTGNSLPDDIKQLYAGATVGTPQYVKNLTTPYFANQQINDYYIVPLYLDGKMVAQSVITIFNGGLCFGEININQQLLDMSSVAASNAALSASSTISSTGRLSSSLSQKLNLGKRTVKSQRLVYKMDYNGTYCRSLLSPMLELSISDGSKYYYASDGRVTDQNTFNSLQSSNN